MRKILVAICLLLLIETNIAVATQDRSTNIHVFMNGGTDRYDDLHIEYTQSIDAPASNPEINPNSLTFNRLGTKLDIMGVIDPGTKVTVKAYSSLNNVQVNRYWWTSGGEQVPPIIPVVYEKIKSEKNGHFKKEIVVNKQVSQVKVTITSKVNVKTADNDLIKKEIFGTQTKVIVEGDAEDATKQGRIGVLIDPPGDIIDEILDIYPSYMTANGYSLSLYSFLILTIVLMTFSIISISRKNKMR